MATSMEILLGPEQLDFGLQQAYLKVACRSATQLEIERYLQRLESDPQCPILEVLLKRRALPSQIERLWQCWSSGSELQAVHLSLAGYFRIQAAADCAWQACGSQDDYDLALAGVNCLLALEQSNYAEPICQRLDEMEGQALFAELFPALAASAGWPDGPERLWAWAQRASVDCLGGIVLGLGLYRSSEKLLLMLSDDRYELYGGGTGLQHWAYQAFRLQGWDIPWLATRLRQTPDSLPLWRSCLAWCRSRLDWLADEREAVPAPASLEQVYRACFAWGDNPNLDGSLAPLCPGELRDELAALEGSYAQALPFELLPGSPL